MKHLLITLILMLGIMPMRAQQTSEITQLTERINKDCPKNISDGLQLMQTEVADGQFMFYYTISDEMFDNISTLGSIIHDSMLAEMESSPDPMIKKLLTLCKTTDTKIVQRLTNSEGKTFDIIILPTEL